MSNCLQRRIAGLFFTIYSEPTALSRLSHLIIDHHIIDRLITITISLMRRSELRRREARTCLPGLHVAVSIPTKAAFAECPRSVHTEETTRDET